MQYATNRALALLLLATATNAQGGTAGLAFGQSTVPADAKPGASSPAASSAALTEIGVSLAAQPVVECRFAQERHVKGFARPLKSSGTLRVSRRHGLRWKQEKPFAMRLLLDERRMVQEVAGQPPQVVTAEGNPQLFQFSRILGALFQGDLGLLEKNFSVTLVLDKPGVSGDAATWVLALVPKEAPLDKVFRKITLEGAKGQILKIRLDDTQGDTTTLRFSDFAPAPVDKPEK